MVKTDRLSRREFLKFSSASALSLALSALPFDSPAQAAENGTYRLGRTVSSLRYYASPSLSSQELGYYVRDTVVKIYETALGDQKSRHNPLWLRTEDGWLESSAVQPVRDQLNEPVMEVPAKGFLAEVTVPLTQAWLNNNGDLKRAYKFYYASTCWVTRVTVDNFDHTWYKVFDDLLGEYYYVLAEHLRRVPAQELTPISPEVTDKRIIVHLADQKISAYEHDRAVFAARMSSGTFEGDTPKGEFKVERKQPVRHMAANTPRGNGFDLPGVPWVSYISWTGVSFHGTYWHNDYGQPRSHGCINLTPEAAKWIYLWTVPHIDPADDYTEAKQGTPVSVVD